MSGSKASSVALHASCVALRGQAVLITGASGSGKSGLALQLIAFGADLIADDKTMLKRHDNTLIATAPDSIKGQIEARGVGILAATPLAAARVRFVVDMDSLETERLPQMNETHLLGVTLPLIRQAKEPHFAAAIWLLLKGGRVA
ncbi:MAG: HPr kinase/phosphatase C-terminal domain-containing protein [Roseovarius sp.]|nr:HPr kinase/phosphatase C-terminal domain-containing protein [Roseovarius sp.]